MNIIMLGAQGTGKGTVAGLISEQTGLPQSSVIRYRRNPSYRRSEQYSEWTDRC